MGIIGENFEKFLKAFWAKFGKKLAAHYSSSLMWSTSF